MAAAPLLASLAQGFFPESAAAAATHAAAAPKAGVTPEVYARIGARTIINGRGTYTYLSGSVELPVVREAMHAASFNYVNLYDLQAAAGAYLAKIAGAESAMVTSGSAGAISAATAACLAGSDPVKIYQLPDLTGMKSEVIMMGARSAFDSAIRLTGARLVVARTVDDLKGAINSKTAMIYNSSQRDDDTIKMILAISKPAGIPMLVDAAAGIPPFENFSHFAKLGVDMYCFSGGKGYVRSAGLRHSARPQGPDRVCPLQLRSVGRLHLPSDEGRQGRDHGCDCRRRLLVQGRSQRPVP